MYYDYSFSSDEFDNDIDLDDKKNESQVDFTGKVAKFPRNVKASKAYNFFSFKVWIRIDDILS